MKKITKAIIPAAGYGTRSLPITKVIPKEMFPIAGKPAIHYIVEEAIRAGIEEILIVVSRNKNMILDYFDRSLELEAFLEKKNKQHLLKRSALPNIHIQYVRQPYAEGLGDAIKLGKHFVGSQPFAVLLPDDIFVCPKQGALEQLVDAYHTYRSSLVALKKVRKDLLVNYGVIKEKQLAEKLYEVVDIVEKPKSSPPSDLAVSGRYIFEPSIFSFLDTVSRGAGGEIQLTDAIKALVMEEKCYGVEVYGERYDIGSEKEYVKLINRMIGNI
ncbi:UTP--glucose-1-phosphate uridylyltransferase [Anaerobacillus alkalilacustris]|uniref:UTP--glucose-1-phosphate uridylyltransferase n=1 Tax=Anaerobacillus alkalilacustris TaxID=393763 RepID=A0A1S2LD06_9BACI|nr:UTP--glucose-1-phosphate uridylyltransferase [Anaerobacillus alkalilacustris]OIJ10378.1 UTP--glucose-1-phosphate uridylyltransferase [Anaerobacillus alkalilacustris]